ncbi:MAG: FkbM family methyltransferase [Bryobacterales bacterium]|nr:FkbM family methyltransferase [Bryobacterales bacterium]
MILRRLLHWAGAASFRVRVNDEMLYLPRQLYGEVGVDLQLRTGTYFEVPVMEALRRVLSPGDCVFDAGCSYGILTCLMARLVGREGNVHAFEANPAVLRWAEWIVKKNVAEGGVRIVHACLAETSGGVAEFYAVPGKSSVASTRNTDIRQFHPDSEALPVPMLSLDDYCEREGIVPRCIKLDVEGSEFLVLKGATRLLHRHRPALLVETHGLEVDGIGGSVAELCAMLASIGYVLKEPISGRPVGVEEYTRGYSARIGYFLAE